MSPRSLVSALLGAGVLAVAVTGCAPAGPAGSGEGPSGTVTVFAAASLKSTFTQLARDFEAKNPGTKVSLNFAGSSDLATQISQGAPADVFASADTRNMTRLADANLLDKAPKNFATNVLEIVVPPSNPADISSFPDLGKPGVKVVVCAPQVPCGAATQVAEKAAGTTLTPVSEESSVTDVLGKVTSQEADAGLVYVTDVKTAGSKVKGIPFPESAQAVTTYPIATVGSARNKELAEAFMDLVTGSEGRKVLNDAGFGTP